MGNKAKRAKTKMLGPIRTMMTVHICEEARRYRVGLLGDGDWLPLASWQEKWFNARGWDPEEHSMLERQQAGVVLQHMNRLVDESDAPEDATCLCYVDGDGGEIAVIIGDNEPVFYAFTHEDMVPEEVGEDDEMGPARVIGGGPAVRIEADGTATPEVATKD